MRSAVCSLLVLAALAMGAPQTFRLRFLDGSYTTALASTAACTTKWQRCERGRVQSLYLQLWVNVGAADSGQVKVDYQRLVVDDTSFVTATDTIATSAICTENDTTGAPAVFDWQYLPKPCWKVRAIITGLAGNSDSTNVGNLVLTLDDLQ